MSNTEATRFRSFAERYLVARAPTFRVGAEQEDQDAWACILRAKGLYKRIAASSQEFKKEPDDDFSI